MEKEVLEIAGITVAEASVDPHCRTDFKLLVRLFPVTLGFDGTARLVAWLLDQKTQAENA